LVKIGKIGLLAASLFALQASAQETQTTRVLGVVANYADTALFRSGPETLRKILREVGGYYTEGSGGAHAFVAEVYPTALQLTQPRPEGRCQLPDRDRLSTALRDAGISLIGYRALVLVVPPSKLGCPGGVQTAFRHQEADGSLRTVPLAISWSLTERYIAHEILHTHGLGHANSLRCRKETLAANCKTREYGNTWDLMGHDGGNFQMISAPLPCCQEPVRFTMAPAAKSSNRLMRLSKPKGARNSIHSASGCRSLIDSLPVNGRRTSTAVGRPPGLAAAAMV